MTNTYKVLGQSNPAATTNTDAYTVPGATSAILSGIHVANRSATATQCRVAIRPAGAAIANQHYIAYDLPIPGNDTVRIGDGLGLAATDVVTVYATLATLTFTVAGVEIT